MGTLYNHCHGKVEFNDTENNIYGFYEIGKVKKRSQEYFEGAVFKDGQKVSDIFGNYAGYMDFDDKRYYDLREIQKIYHQYQDLPEEESLPSDSTKRHDLVLLASEAI